ncbi:MAG: ArnT family glycosyltransferase [Bryobacteraceae bacterium]
MASAHDSIRTEGLLSAPRGRATRLWNRQALVIAIAAFIYFMGVIIPPHLMDDVDAAEATQAKNFLLSGNWVTGHLNGVVYIDKAPLKYWITASLYSVFGIHDWVAKLPTAIAAVLLVWLVMRMASWAISRDAGFYSGLVLSTSIGMYLFTRTVIPDIILVLLIACTLWCFVRLLESPKRSLVWALAMYASAALGVLTKGFIGVVFPAGIVLVYLLFTGKLLDRETWHRMHVYRGVLLFLAIAAPWHILAIMQNPPYFDLTMHASPHFGGHYRGFFWFYFINEQVLRFLNERWPRDYATVPRLWFWASLLVWFFPWSLVTPGAVRLRYKPVDRAGRLHLLALCWIGVVMIFFSFSTTQGYYALPVYPACALLLGSVIAAHPKWVTGAMRTSGVIAAAALAAIVAILVMVWNLPTPGDISDELQKNYNLYKLALGHIADLTLPAFAYLRTPLILAAIAFLVGALGTWLLRGRGAILAAAAMLVIFYQAARLALITFDPYMSSYAIANTLNHAPKGTLIIYGEYNRLSSVFFYHGDHALIWNGRYFILEYGSYAPDAPKVFIDTKRFKHLWHENQRFYLIVRMRDMKQVKTEIDISMLHFITKSGDKFLYTNLPPAPGGNKRLPTTAAAIYN